LPEIDIAVSIDEPSYIFCGFNFCIGKLFLCHEFQHSVILIHKQVLRYELQFSYSFLLVCSHNLRTSCLEAATLYGIVKCSSTIFSSFSHYGCL